MRSNRIFTTIFIIISLLISISLSWSAPNTKNFTLKISDNFLISLKAQNAPLKDIVAELSKKLNVEINLIGRVDSKVSAYMVDDQLESFIERLAENWSAEYLKTNRNLDEVIKINIFPKEDLNQRYLSNISSEPVNKELLKNDTSNAIFLNYKDRILSQKSGAIQAEFIADELMSAVT